MAAAQSPTATEASIIRSCVALSDPGQALKLDLIFMKRENSLFLWAGLSTADAPSAADCYCLAVGACPRVEPTIPATSTLWSNDLGGKGESANSANEQLAGKLSKRTGRQCFVCGSALGGEISQNMLVERAIISELKKIQL